MFLPKKIVTVGLFLVFLVMTAFSAAWGQSASGDLGGIDSITVRLNDGTTVDVVSGGQLETKVVFVNTNLVEIEVSTTDASSIEVNKETVVGDSGSFKVFLKPGQNKIPVAVSISSEGTTVTKKLDVEIFYLWGAENPSTYILSQYPLSGKVSVFDGDVGLDFPKLTFVATANSDGTVSPSEEQSVYFRISTCDPVGGYPGSDSPGFGEGYTVGNYVTVLPFSVKNFGISGNPNEYFMSNSGFITLKYDENIRGDAAKTLTVYYATYGGNYWYNLGGVVNTASCTIKAPFKGFGHYVIKNMLSDFAEYYSVNQATYKEVSWSRIYVEPLWARGVFGDIAPDGKGYLGLKEEITRGELAMMLVLGMGLPREDFTGTDWKSIYFKDVNSSSSLTELRAECIETAAKYGLVRGVPNESNGTVEYQYGNYLTRQEAAAILARALGLKVEDDMTKVEKQIKSAFKNDYSSISPWAWPYVYAVYKAKYMVGKGNGTFGPTDNLTKAEAAKIVYLVMKNLKKI